jgi:hypothetical protein
MAQIRIEDPELYTTKTVDDSGRIYLGKEYSNKQVKIAIERVDDTNEGNEEGMTPETAD